VEDPIEFQIPGVNQVQVNERAKLTFAGALRSILRQDPDVVMIGEIRDRETAGIAFQAAQTGHLVLSSLHTNDSVASLTRLGELGVEPYLIAESTLIVMAQRLARRNCTECNDIFVPNAENIRRLGISADDAEFKRGKGCDYCRQTGYRGRIGLFEVLPIDPSLSELILNGANSLDIRNAAMSAGMKTMFQDAIDKIKDGLTTPEEVLRVVLLDEEFRKTVDRDYGEKEAEIANDVDFELPFDEPEVITFSDDEPTGTVEISASDFLEEDFMAVDINSDNGIRLRATIEPIIDSVEDTREEGTSVDGPAKPFIEETLVDVSPLQPSEIAVEEHSNASTEEITNGLEEIIYPNGSYQVLLVDDNEETNRLVQLLLRRFRFISASSLATVPTAAVEQSIGKPPHLIVLNLDIEAMNGFEFIAQIRADLKTAFIPIVALTSDKDERKHDLALQFGADAILLNPVQPRELELTVTNILNTVYSEKIENEEAAGADD
jgi:CheY-like chemotaxis protein